MIMKLISIKSMSALVAISSALAACGGGNSSSPAATPLVAGTDIPVAATETTAAAISFANLTVASSDDTTEPLAVGEAALATSETDEPDPSV
jgi:hypothetical protein